MIIFGSINTYWAAASTSVIFSNDLRIDLWFQEVSMKIVTF